MIVPQYWAEAKHTLKRDGKQKTLKRFGWSDLSQQDAEQHAQRRLEQAITTSESGQPVHKVEHKVAYNGAEGLPIREEIIQRLGNTLITRNSYGALCLNTPNVMFADIDLNTSTQASRWVIRGVWLVLLCIVVFASVISDTVWLGVILLVLLCFLSSRINRMLLAYWLMPNNKLQNIALQKIELFSQQHSDLHLRVYQTPAGFRVLVMNRLFDPSAAESITLLKQLNSDPIYIEMCRRQHCFRARVSPKPWRIGQVRLRPRPGVWPIKAEHIVPRQHWVQQYEQSAQAFAACRYLKKLGSDDLHIEAEAVQHIHDQLCRSASSLTLA